MLGQRQKRYQGRELRPYLAFPYDSVSLTPRRGIPLASDAILLKELVDMGLGFPSIVVRDSTAQMMHDVGLADAVREVHEEEVPDFVDESRSSHQMAIESRESTSSEGECGSLFSVSKIQEQLIMVLTHVVVRKGRISVLEIRNEDEPVDCPDVRH